MIRRKYDAVLIGAGIMSSTLAVLIKKVKPTATVLVIEKLPAPGQESSQAFNNAGTGHSGFCELNYDLEKASRTFRSFEISKQFWSFLAKEGELSSEFFTQVPHVSFVTGLKDVTFLRERHKFFSKVPFFKDIEYSEDTKKIAEWIPTVMNGRKYSCAATYAKNGLDIDYGKLTEEMVSLAKRLGVEFNFRSSVKDIFHEDKKRVWSIATENEIVIGKYVFIGAGGATLSLLEKTKIKGTNSYGGFPVSGKWLISESDPAVILHHAKVYGKPVAGSPPMSMPHLDTRIIDGKRYLIFGPFAGFSTKFLKNGSIFDFFMSITFKNFFTTIESGLRNFSLVTYLFKEVCRGKRGKFNLLKKFYPELSDKSHWVEITAGQRVQTIRRRKGKAHIEFGTELFISPDKRLAALLGASPGASTSVYEMIRALQESILIDKDVEARLLAMVPGIKKGLSDEEFLEITNSCTQYLFK